MTLNDLNPIGAVIPSCAEVEMSEFFELAFSDYEGQFDFIDNVYWTRDKLIFDSYTDNCYQPEEYDKNSIMPMIVCEEELPEDLFNGSAFMADTYWISGILPVTKHSFLVPEANVENNRGVFYDEDSYFGSEISRIVSNWFDDFIQKHGDSELGFDS